MSSIITISMPESLRDFVSEKVRNGGYSTVSEYIRELIRLDQRLDLARVDPVNERQADRELEWDDLRGLGFVHSR